MRTNIVLDEALVNEASRLTGIKTRRALVQEALKTLIASKKRTSLSALRGKIHFAPGFDYKKTRSQA